MKVLFKTVKQLVDIAEKEQKPISEIMIEQEMLLSRRSREEIIAHMYQNLTVMEEAVEKGLQGVQSTSGLTVGDAVLLQQYIDKGETLSKHLLLYVVSKAISTKDFN